MFKFFNHSEKSKPESQTLNTAENEEQIQMEDSAEITYRSDEYKEAVNEINLDPEFFIKKVEEMIGEGSEGLKEIDPAEGIFSEGPEVSEVDGVDVLGNIVPFEAPINELEVRGVQEQNSKEGGIQRMIKRALPFAAAFAVLSSAACNKRGQFGIGVGSKTGDEGPTHWAKVFIGVETHTDEVGPDGNPVKKTKDGKIVGVDQESKKEGGKKEETKKEENKKEEPKRENPKEDESKKETGTTTKRDAGAEYDTDDIYNKPESEKTEEPSKETPKEPEPAEATPVTKPTEVAPVTRPSTESTPANHEGPGRKIAEYIDRILPLGDVENGKIVLNDAALEAISKGCLAYSRNLHCFATSLTKDFKKQGLSVEAVTIYGLHKGDKPRPPMLGKFFSDYAKIINQNPLQVDYRFFDMKRFDEDLKASVDKDDYIDKKGKFNEKRYTETVKDVTDYGHEILKTYIAWLKLNKQDAAKEALFKAKCVPLMNRE